jgi:hypothetical protein
MKLSKADRRRIRQRKRALRKLPHMKTKFRFVDHPRYGNQPIRSNEGHSRDAVRRAFWQYGGVPHEQLVIFPETAIRADLSKQRYGYSPRMLYVDIARPCRKCGRWFLFFALEQQYWFESLGFFCDSDCVHCQECRHARHDFEWKIERYGALLGQGEKSAEEWRELSELGDILWDAGYIRKPETLQRTRMPRRLRIRQ